MRILREAAKWVDRMLHRGFTPDAVAYGLLMHGLCRTGRVDEARALMSAKRLSLNTVGYNCFISAVCKAVKDDKIEAALRLYQNMLLEGVIAETVTYNTLIHVFLRRGAIQEALKLVNDMLFRGCPLDEITYNGPIKALCKAGAVDKGTGKVNTALEFLRDMTHRGLTPDIVTYDSLRNVGTARGACLMMLVSFCIEELRTAFYLMMLLVWPGSQLSSFGDTSCLQVKFYKHGKHFSVKSHVLVMVAVYPICKVKISKGDVHIISPMFLNQMLITPIKKEELLRCCNEVKEGEMFGYIYYNLKLNRGLLSNVKIKEPESNLSLMMVIWELKNLLTSSAGSNTSTLLRNRVQLRHAQVLNGGIVFQEQVYKAVDVAKLMMWQM
ncbi:pentatricopeptide repeat-containing protein At5g64320, mitochondrial-like [Pistacia vera]|uniref:pentatricopeptide repeat-containing protein At5g64320, mitochondrial-like n=1 Tax=Pistacia vera TaxID=55513 RepID=UPI001263133B|nr:pentatricopeptide repeat-containing protein At5g64320, mitochondrial-like [Pistacia vera]